MNSKAQDKARQAELGDYLLEKFYKIDRGHLGEFVQWLEDQAQGDAWIWKNEAQELIALYESL